MSDPWWTPARRKLYGRQTPNGITCQSCGHDVCQCSPRAATIGEHVDAVLAAKDAEIERLRQFLARANADHDRACDALAAATRERDEAVVLLRKCQTAIEFLLDQQAMPDEEAPRALLADLKAFLARTEPSA